MKPVKRKSRSAIAVGNSVFIRTVTMAFTGKIVEATEHALVLSDAAWIAYTGRFADFLKTGTASGMEVEPYPGDVTIPCGGIIDVSTWNHPLPREQK